MIFNKWLNLQESNLNNLFVSTVNAFPHTKKRQHSVDLVNIVEVNWTPFLGVNTLFIRAAVYSGESKKEYNTHLLFKNVVYHSSKMNENWVEIIANDGRNYVFEKLNGNNEVLVRCNCADFYWRFNYFDHEDKSLYGKVRTKYEGITNPGSANPLKMPGMCKHLIKLVRSLDHSGFLER